MGEIPLPLGECEHARGHVHRGEGGAAGATASMLAWLSLAIVFATLVLIVIRPFGIVEAWVAISGAALMVLVGILSI